MPLFESQNSRNRRLFDRVGAELQPELDRYLVEYPWAGVAFASLMGACVVGGISAAITAVEACTGLKRAWGRGDDRKAWALVEVFTLAMVSRWYRAFARHVAQLPQEEREGREPFATLEVFAISVLNLFEDDSPTGLEDFLKLDAQYNYDMDQLEDEGRVGDCVETKLLLLRALKACGHPSDLDLSRLRLPIEGRFGLVAEAVRLDIRDLKELFAAWLIDDLVLLDSLAIAERHMHETAEKLSDKIG